jgi:hypothetical protein
MVILSSGPVREIKLKRADGVYYDLVNLKPDDFPIGVIASALAQVNRFGGHCKFPYSVAVHSVLVSLLLPEEWQYEGLMHDITEGTGLNDVCAPVKSELPDYKILEAHVRKQLALVYGMAEVEPKEIKEADLKARALEGYFLRGEPNDFYARDFYIAQPLLSREIPWQGAREMFLEHYKYLMGVRGLN